MALEREDLLVIQDLDNTSGQPRLMKCTVSSLFVRSAELEGIDGGTKELSVGEFDYPDVGDEDCNANFCISVGDLTDIENAPAQYAGTPPCSTSGSPINIPDLPPLDPWEFNWKNLKFLILY